MPYEAFALACFDWAPVRRDEALLDAAAEIDLLLPGRSPTGWRRGTTGSRSRRTGSFRR
jgi:hypothetical protein